MSERLYAGEPASWYVDRLEHAARVGWRFAREHPDEREKYLRFSRRLADLAAELRKSA